MSLVSITRRHKLRWFKVVTVSGPSGGKKQETVELGTVFGTVNPDSDLQSSDFDIRDEQITASIYFSFDPHCRATEFYQIIGDQSGKNYDPVDNGDIYRVESVLNFQRQNRLWRVRAIKRESLAST